MKLFKKALAILMISTMCLTTVTACGNKDTTTQEQQKQSVIVAKVGEVPIYKTDLENQIAQYGMSEYYMTLYYGEDYTSNPEIVDQYNLFKDDVLETLIESEILVLKAKEMDAIKVTSEEINKALEETKASFASEEEFNTALKESNLTLDDLKEDIEKNLYVTKLIEYYAQNETTVTESEADTYYNENPDSFKKATISHILVDSEEKAQEILDKYKAGTSFADLAKEYGTDGTKDNGGSLGEIPYDTTQYDADFMTAAKQLGEGEVSDPVQTQFGWHLIKVDNIQVTPLEEARAEVLSMLQQVEASQVLMEKLETWKTEYKIERFKDNYYTQLTEPKATDEAANTTDNATDTTNTTTNNAATNQSDTTVIGGADSKTDIVVSDETTNTNTASSTNNATTNTEATTNETAE